MPKNNSTQKNNKSHGLFGCLAAPREDIKMEISAPIQDLEKELHSKKELSIKEELQLIDEIIKKIPLLENLTEKTVKQQHLLSLMRSIKVFSEKTRKTFDERTVLEGMIKMYEKKNFDWSKFESRIPINSLFGEQLRSVQLKKTINKIHQTNSLITEEKNSLRQFIITNETLVSVKLTPVHETRCSNEDSISPELAEILAKRIAISEGRNTIGAINELAQEKNFIGANLISKTDLADQDKYSESISIHETVDRLSTISEEDSQRNSTISNQKLGAAPSLESMCDSDSLKEFEKYEKEAEAEEQLTDNSISVTSAFFSAANQKPIIVGEVLKLKI